MLTTFAHAGHDHNEPEYPTSLQDGKMYSVTSSVGEPDFSPLSIVLGGTGAILVIAVLVVIALRKQPKATRRSR